MEVEKPIFIVGVGRSGSTVFHQVFSEHPHLAWLSGLCDRYPHQPELNRSLMRAIDFPLFAQLLKTRIKPSEAYNFWEYYCKGFSRPCRDILAADVTVKNKKNVRNALSKILTQKRNRLLVKLTGWPRISLIQEIFNDAKFIHIVRDGRAVVNSMINVNWWEGWKGPHNWRWGELTPSQQAEWEKCDRSFIALAGIEWNILMAAMEKVKLQIKPENFLEIKYENLCDRPIETFNNVLNFNDIAFNCNFQNRILNFNLQNQNFKWKIDLTEQQKIILESVIGENLKKYNYL